MIQSHETKTADLCKEFWTESSPSSVLNIHKACHVQSLQDVPNNGETGGSPSHSCSDLVLGFMLLWLDSAQIAGYG
jgi:hypothetical protein